MTNQHEMTSSDTIHCPSGKQEWPFFMYETLVVDWLVRAGCCSPMFLEVHGNRIRKHYDACFTPESCADCLADTWRTGVELGCAWAKPAKVEAKPESKAMRDTMRAIEVARRNGCLI